MQMYRTRAEKGFRQEGRSVYADKITCKLRPSVVFLKFSFSPPLFLFLFSLELWIWNRHVRLCVQISNCYPIVNCKSGGRKERREEKRGLKSRLTKIGATIVGSPSSATYRWVRVIEPRSGENRSVSANGLRRKTQLSRNQSLISHLVSVLRQGLLCEISLFIFLSAPPPFRNTYIRSRNREREREGEKGFDRAFEISSYRPSHHSFAAPRYCIKTRWYRPSTRPFNGCFNFPFHSAITNSFHINSLFHFIAYLKLFYTLEMRE